MSFLSKVFARSSEEVYFGSDYKTYKPKTDYSTYGVSGCFFGHGLYVSTSKSDAKSYGKYIRTLTLPNIKFFDVSNLHDFELLYKYLKQDFKTQKTEFLAKKTGVDEMSFFRNLFSLLEHDTNEVGPVAVTRKIEQMGYAGLYIPKRIGGGEGDWYTFFKPEKYFKPNELKSVA